MTDLIDLQAALGILLSGVEPIAAEKVPIGECAGRVLAEDVVATRDQPPAAVSAMDGYAVRRADLASDAMLDLIGEAPAGKPFDGTVGPYQAIRIATGGLMPGGADHVLIQEEAERIANRIRVGPVISKSSFVRLPGGDFRAGDSLLKAGAVITPARHGLIAAANAGVVNVCRKPKVAVMPNGDELREPGQPLDHGQSSNSASYAIADLIGQWGGEAVRGEILPDAPQVCEAMLRSRLGVDVVVILGGASVGDRDSMRPLIERLGATILFERIAVVPGKPSWHARFPDGRLVIGLPGNPASAFVCAYLLLKPLLFALAGRDPDQRLMTARLEAPIPANGEREAYWRAFVRIDETGELWVRAAGRQDSSLLTPLATANALLRRPPHARAGVAEEKAQFLPLHDLFPPS